VLTSADGTVYNISAGNTGNMTAKNYIYLDIAVSTTAYQKTTTASTAVGVGKLLIGVAQNNAGEATFQIFNGQGAKNIDASEIVAGSITANEIAASTITAAKMNVSQLSALAADLGSITTGTVTSATFRTAASGARTEINATDGIKGVDSGGNIQWQGKIDGSLYAAAIKSYDNNAIINLSSAANVIRLQRNPDVSRQLDFYPGLLVSRIIQTSGELSVETVADGAYSKIYLKPEGTTRLETSAAGISVTGNITVSGTVDGVDVAAHAAAATAHGVTGNIVGTNMTSSLGASYVAIPGSTGGRVGVRMGSSAGVPSYTDLTDGELVVWQVGGAPIIGVRIGAGFYAVALGSP
jgi:hypothetical protein